MGCTDMKLPCNYSIFCNACLDYLVKTYTLCFLLQPSARCFFVLNRIVGTAAYHCFKSHSASTFFSTLSGSEGKKSRPVMRSTSSTVFT